LTGRVTYVFDGDTLVLTDGPRRRVRVRLYGIDAPEIGRSGESGQPGGREARRALLVKLSGRTVTVEVRETDPYGRTIGVVRLAGRDINREMVGDGWAWAYRHYLEGPYASAYLGAEKSARTRRAGLWSRSNPEPPWEFRHRREQ
jgi:endonuclease YncB( thermonuclease family)